MMNHELRVSMRALYVLPLFWLLFGSVLPSATADSNVVVRVMACNITGNSQFYGTPELNILKGLKADVVAIQEFQYSSPTTNGVNTPAAFREMIDTAFGTGYVYFRENITASGPIPNGIISRYPILTSGQWTDNSVANRGFAWAQIDLPGTNDLYIVSVHLLTSSSGARATEATQLTGLIQANFPSNAWIIVAGDFNTDSRSEACMSTFETYLSDNPIPVDNNGNSNTSMNRNHPHDYVLPSFPMTNTLTTLVLPSHTFPNGLVFDSRVYTPLSDVPPVQSTDSSSAQHMGVFKDFLVPVQLVSGALLSVTPISDLSSSGHAGGPFIPTNQLYSLSNSGNSNLNWTASKSANWVTLSATAGTLAPGSNEMVTVSINANADNLSAGSYSDIVVFTNTTNGAGSTTRTVNLSVNATFPVIVTNGWTLSTENCVPGNGGVDPGETVTVSLSLKNTGSASTSNLVATLVANSGVTLPSDPQSFGIVSTNGTPVSQPFTFTAVGTCGDVLTATLQLQDGASSLGTVNFTIPLGVTTAIFTQNFDSVSAPSLPAGWTTSSSGAQSNWITSTALADTAPNAAYSPDPGDVGVNELDSPSIPINSSLARLTFRHNYSLAASSVNSATGYNGGVLEIKIGGGSYMDIVVAGGSFISGGYSRTLSSSYSNPLAGQQAWSGVSGGFTTTVVGLPASAAGQNIQLRWRCASGTNPPPVTSSGTLAYWNFDASNAIPNVVAANLSVSPVALSNATGSVTFPSGNPGVAISGSGFTATGGAPTASYSCYTFSLAISNSSQVTLSNISFDDQRSGTGPTNFTVQISQLANFSSVIFDSGVKTSHTAIASSGNSFPLANSNLTGMVYFRIYVNGTGNPAGTWRMDNLNVQGSVTSGGTIGGSGWYVDSISIQDAFCCTNFVNAPVADFTGSPTAGAAPLAVAFNDASTGTITNWFWDFGDGGNTNIATNSIAHTYAAGTFDVALIVSGPNGVSTNTKIGYITALTPFQSWQIQYFSNTNNPSAAGDIDADGDGLNNTNEFLAGTDPTNSASFFGIIAVMPVNTNILVTWQMAPGKTNALQFTDGAANGSYSNDFTDLWVVTNTTGNITNYTDDSASGTARRYYRVRIIP